MPFDALILRQLTREWQNTLVGTQWTQASLEPGRVRLRTSTKSGSDLLIVLTPGLARIHQVPSQARKDREKKRSLPTFFDLLLPAEIVRVQAVPWERIVHFELEQEDDLGSTRTRTLIVELAGHLTNLILVNQDKVVVDALKRVSPSSQGRTVFPGHVYTPPPALKDPCQSRDPKDLPPLARRRLGEVGEGFWQTLCHDYAQASFGSYHLQNDKEQDVWVYPLAGFHAVPIVDLDASLDRVFTEKERQLYELGQRKQYVARLTDHILHLESRLQEWKQWMEDDGELDRELGDLWLAHQHQFRTGLPPRPIVVESFSQPGRQVLLRLDEGRRPHEMAEQAYRRYKKAKSRQQVARRLVGQVQGTLASQTLELQRVQSGEMAPQEIAERLSKATLTSMPGASASDPGDKVPYRRFTSQHGYAIWVGRSRDENQSLTFRRARPDDMWFHAKQVPGSHVILFCGKSDPPLEDLLDAADLAVFYSSAQHSSMVPVDYTRRKFVRKRPHAEPGQVLYGQEKTLYITPDSDRLKRLGAVRERLGDLP